MIFSNRHIFFLNMKTCNNNENWLEGVFENEKIGETLSKLTEEYDCLISSNKGGIKQVITSTNLKE